jgi:predicted  nucleic acid-binding Zn-ribbon protein
VLAAEVATKKYERQLRVERNDADKVWASLQKAEATDVELRETLMAKCDELQNMKREVGALEHRVRDAETKMRSLQLQYASKCADLDKLNATFDSCKELDIKSKRVTKKRMDDLKTERDKLTTVSTLVALYPLAISLI